MADMLIIDPGVLYATSKNRSYRKKITVALATYIRFLQDAGLATRTILQSDEHVDENLKVWKSDLTDEGFEFVKRAEQKWFRALDRGKSPTDLSILQKELARLRKD